MRIFIEDLLLLINGIIQVVKLRLYGVKVSLRLVRALSRIHVKVVVKPNSGIIKQYTKLLLVIVYLPDRSIYIVPDLASIALLWHVRDVRDYERFIRIKSGAIIVDVGAHVGFFTIHAYKSKRGKCFCVAYEPHPFNCALLKLNCKLNSIYKCIVRPYAISAREGLIKLYIHDESGGHSIYVRSSRVIVVKSTTLDREIKYIAQILARQTSLAARKHHVYVKIDVEGAEKDVLKGSTYFIRKYRPYIVLEAHKTNILEIFSILRPNNYVIFITPFVSDQVHIHAIPGSMISS